MNNINEILNSQTPADVAALQPQNGNGPVSGKGNSNGNSFGNILSQLSSQNGQSANTPGSALNGSQAPVNAGGSPKGVRLPQAVPSVQGTTNTSGLAGSITSASETTIAVSESLQVNNSNQLAQAEQALVSLAEALAKMFGALSQIQSGNSQQAQSALAAITGGNPNAPGVASLLNAIHALEKTMGSSQNPLSLSSGQQGNLLVQMFQQMLQNQQILFGTSPNAGTGTSSGAISTTDAMLQFAFSDVNLTQTQQTGSQSSQVFINLENFKMSATFVQPMGNGAGGQNPNTAFQPVAPTGTLLNAINQAVQNGEAQNLPAGTVTSPQAVVPQGQSANAEGGLEQNLQNLAQLLMQSGVSQAALTTFMNQNTGLANANQTGMFSQNAAVDQALNSLAPTTEIPPATKVESTALSTDNNGNATASLAGPSITAESSTQSSVAVEIQPAQLVSAPGTNSATAQAVPSAVFEVQPDIPLVNNTELNTINQTIAQFNLLNHNDTTQTNQQVTSSVPSATVDQLLAQLQSISTSQVPGSNVANQTVGVVNQAPLSQGGSSLTTLLPSVAGPAAVLLPNEPVVTGGFPAAGIAPTAPPTSANPGSITVPGTVAPNSINASIQTASGAAVTNQAAVVTSLAPPPATPPPVSQAPNVSTSIIAGEAIKNEGVIQTPTSNDLSNPLVITSIQSDTSAKPITAQAVSPLSPTTEVTSNLAVSDSLTNNTSNDSVIAQATVSPLLNMGAAQADKSNTGQLMPPPSNAGGNPNGNIESTQILNQISQQVAAQMETAKTVSRLNFQLIPESLGRVTVQLALVDQSVSARIIVTNPDVREAIQTHLVDLQSALNQAGLQIDQLQVQVQGGGTNLLAQYYQYQQEGSGYRLPTSFDASEGAQNVENTGISGLFSTRNSLVNVLA